MRFSFFLAFFKLPRTGPHDLIYKYLAPSAQVQSIPQYFIDVFMTCRYDRTIGLLGVDILDTVAMEMSRGLNSVPAGKRYLHLAWILITLGHYYESTNGDWGMRI